jgi:hypothetical protein
MSEAAEAIPFQQLGEAFVVANPGPELSRKLEGFYSDTRRQLGGRALVLASDNHLRVFREPIPEDFKKYVPDVVTPKDLSAMQSNLRRRGPIHPIVDNHVGVEPERDKNGKIAEQPGIVLRFNILVDKLTAQALRSTWLINSDQAIPMHIAIPRHHMRMGSELLEARDDLLEALKDTSPLTVEGLHLSSPNVRI